MNNQIDIEDLKNRLAKLFEFIDINNKRGVEELGIFMYSYKEKNINNFNFL